MRRLIAICLMLLGFSLSSLQAQLPIHTIKLSSGASFEILSKQNSFSAYPFSERIQQAMKNGSRKTVLGADYASTGIEISTKDPKGAIKEILNQIVEQTDRRLGVFMNTSTEKIAPSAILMAADKNSVWFLTLTPKPQPPSLAPQTTSHVYTFTCTYLIDEPTSDEPRNYVIQTIACDEKHESLIEDAFSSYHLLLTVRELKAGELRIPAHLTKTQGDTLLFDRAFYISPNVLRGFELIVPANSMTQKGETWISTVPLSVENEQTRQGITSLRLKAK
jgi:hypothetical protein